MDDPFVARTVLQARLLLDIRFSPVLGAVMVGEASASEVALRASLPLGQTHHRLTRLLGAGLIEVGSVQKRAGRAIRLYRAASRYTVPFKLTEAATVEELMARMYRPYLRALVRQQAEFWQYGQLDLRLRIDRRGQLEYDFGPQTTPEDRRTSYGTAGTALLLPGDALYLRRELTRLREWATERHTTAEAARSYLLCLMLTPGQLEEEAP